MNNETLKTDLCSRLPHGVLVETTKWQNNGQGKPMTKAVGKLIGYSDRTGYEVVFNEDDFAEDFHNIKPILFPISCLTQEITVNGETFVPREELKKNSFSHVDWITTEREHWIEKYGFEEWVRLIPCGIIELLNKWHVNYRLYPSQFIPATNEYA